MPGCGRGSFILSLSVGVLELRGPQAAPVQVLPPAGRTAAPGCLCGLSVLLCKMQSFRVDSPEAVSVCDAPG